MEPEKDYEPKPDPDPVPAPEEYPGPEITPEPPRMKPLHELYHPDLYPDDPFVPTPVTSEPYASEADKAGKLVFKIVLAVAVVGLLAVGVLIGLVL